MSDDVAAISLKDVTLGHGERILFRKASIQLAPGSFTLLTGGNGQGKTTLLRAVLGLHPVRFGEIRVLGATPCAARNRIGYLPQDRRLPTLQMTGRALIASAWRGTRLGVPSWGRQLDNALDDALALTGATALALQPLSQLSGGERQRVFLAGALLTSPSLLLLDEPLGGMDVQWRKTITTLLYERCRRSNMAVLMSCHGIDSIRPYADHILQISDQAMELSDAAL